MKELNETQRKMYEYLAEQAQRGVMPTVREIGSHVGLKSTGSVQRYLERLEEAGYIEREPLDPREGRKAVHRTGAAARHGDRRHADFSARIH